MKWEQKCLFIILICSWFYIKYSYGSCNICKCIFMDDLINCSYKNLSSLPKDDLYDQVRLYIFYYFPFECIYVYLI